MKILPLTPCILATPIPIPEVAAQHIRAACNRAWPEKPPMREYCEHDGVAFWLEVRGLSPQIDPFAHLPYNDVPPSKRPPR